MSRNRHIWKAGMPRNKPAANKVQAVFAIRTPTGYRAEISGEFREDIMLVLWKAMNGVAAYGTVDVDNLANELREVQKFTKIGPETPEGETKEC